MKLIQELNEQKDDLKEEMKELHQQHKVRQLPSEQDSNLYTVVNSYNDENIGENLSEQVVCGGSPERFKSV